MKRKNLLFILLILIIAYLSLAFYPDLVQEAKEGTSTDLSQPEDQEEVEPEAEERPKIQEKKVLKANLLAVGDLMFHMPQNNAALDPVRGVYDYRDNFKYVKKYIKAADLSIGNFETVVLEGQPYSGFPRFNSPKETLAALKDAGFDILTTANNHCLDQGREGLVNTIDLIEDFGMKNLGSYKKPQKDILIEDINGIKIGLLAYSYGFNGLEYSLTEEERSYMLSEINEEKIKEDIERAQALGSDLVAVFIHWGHEYHREPSQDQIDLGHKMVGWGANLILGSHPHVLQKSEIVRREGRDNFIIYSMGNFLSNQRLETMDNPATEDGIMLNIELEKDLDKGTSIIKNIDYIASWVRKYPLGNKNQYEIIPIEEFLQDEDLYNSLEEWEQIRLKESLERTMEIFQKIW